MLKAKLTVVGGDAKASEVQLRLPTIIGRGREASLTLPHPLVSRRHTEIFERDGRLVVRDLGSLNGTFVNNQRIEGEQVLEPNQLLTLGNVTFRAIYDIAAAADSSDPSVSHVQVPHEVSGTQNVATKPISEPGSHNVGARLSTVELEQKTDSREETGRSEAAGNRGSRSHSVASNQSNAESRSPEKAKVRILPGESVAETPVSIGQLSGVPAPATSAIDLADQLGLESTEAQAASAIDPADFQFDGVDEAVENPSESDLGSFLKKLPR
jgi:hypothetical protein